MEIVQIRKNLSDLPDEIFDIEEEFLKEKAQLEYMKDLTKPLLANLMSEYRNMSNAEKERNALARKEYRDHIEGVRAQTLILAEKTAKFHRLERKFEAMRSLNKNIV